MESSQYRRRKLFDDSDDDAEAATQEYNPTPLVEQPKAPVQEAPKVSSKLVDDDEEEYNPYSTASQ
jgi:hypothetical protein